MINKKSKLNTRILIYLIVGLILLFFSVVPAMALIEDNGTGYSDPLTNLPDGNRVKILFPSLRDKTYTQGDWPFGFPVLGWSDIPNLIKIAESERMLQNYPVSDTSFLSLSSSSYSSEKHTKGMITICQEGMIALWLIEGICKF